MVVDQVPGMPELKAIVVPNDRLTEYGITFNVCMQEFAHARFLSTTGATALIR